MICNQCGKELPEEATFCPECGAPLTKQGQSIKDTAAEEGNVMQEETVAASKEDEQEKEKTEQDLPEQGKSVLSKLSRNVKVVAAVGAAFLVVLLVLLFSGSKGRYTFAEPGSGYYMGGPDDVLFNLDGDIKKANDSWYSLYRSADASLTVLFDEDGTLYVVGKKGLEKVADDVEAMQVSFFGDTIAYVSDTEDSVGSLYLYQVSNGKSALIDKEAYAGSFVLSPDGKSVAYIGDCELGAWASIEGDLYISKNGKKGEKLYSNSVPLALTNGGKHIYYIKEEERLYMDDERIASNVAATFYFNADNTEMIYGRDGNTYYYVMGKTDSVKLRGSSCNGPVVPSDLAIKWVSLRAGSVYSYGMDSFDKTLFRFGEELYYVSDKGNSVEKLGRARSYKLSADGKSLLLCESDGDLCYVKNIHKSLEAKKLGDDLEADSFVASSDLKKIYYMSDGEIFYLSGDKGVRVADEADAYVYSDKYGVVYFICDKELFYATTKAKSKQKVMGESVEALVMIGPELLLAFEDEDGISSVYKITGKKKAEALVTEED